MSRLNSFYLPPELWPVSQGRSVTLAGTEARHMTTVLRTENGSQVRLFDGNGRSGLFRVKDAQKSEVLLEAVQLASSPSPLAGLTLAIGWSKSKRRSYLFEKTVELKGMGLIFWQAARSQGHVPQKPKSTWVDKCIQAAKQCGNPHLPHLTTLTDGLDGLTAQRREYDRCYFAWESETASNLLVPSMLSKGRSLVVIGPEGGFEEREALALVRAGFEPVTLGDSILRWETAATYCLSLAFLSNGQH